MGIDFFNGRHAERGGFAGAGLGLADDIAAGQQHWDGFGLNRRGLLKAQFIDGFQQFGGKAQFRKQLRRH